MRVDNSDIPQFLKKEDSDLDIDKYNTELKGNLLFGKETCLVCEECCLILNDVNRYTDADFKAIIINGQIRRKIVRIYNIYN